MPALYLKDSQQHLADLADADLAAMLEAMEEESSTDRDYFIDLDTVYLLRAVGLAEPVAAALEKAIGESDGIDVVWR
jgi:hypothetical protein